MERRPRPNHPTITLRSGPFFAAVRRRPLASIFTESSSGARHPIKAMQPTPKTFAVAGLALIRRMVATTAGVSLIGLAALLVGCTSIGNAPSGHPEWTPYNVSGLKILLVDSSDFRQFEWLAFAANGGVQIESGTNGPERRETLHWRITPTGALGIYSDIDIYDELTLLSRTAKTLVVKRRSGTTAKYKILFDEHLTRRWSGPSNHTLRPIPENAHEQARADWWMLKRLMTKISPPAAIRVLARMPAREPFAVANFVLLGW